MNQNGLLTRHEDKFTKDLTPHPYMNELISELTNLDCRNIVNERVGIIRSHTLNCYVTRFQEIRFLG